MSHHVVRDDLGVVLRLAPGEYVVVFDVRIGKMECSGSGASRNRRWRLGHDSTPPGRHITTRTKEPRRCVRNRQQQSTLKTEGTPSGVAPQQKPLACFVVCTARTKDKSECRSHSRLARPPAAAVPQALLAESPEITTDQERGGVLVEAMHGDDGEGLGRPAVKEEVPASCKTPDDRWTC